MDKAKILIERHVQWLVLALAFLYVGFTVWDYVWNPPLTVNLPPAKNVKPGDIDETIRTTKVVPLLQEIDNKVVSAPKVTDVLTDFDDRLNEKRTEVVDMKNLWDAPSWNPGIQRGGGGGGGPIVAVSVLPDLPPAIFKASSIRRTVIMAPGRKDIAYWSGRFTIDSNALANAVAQAFAKPGIPPNLFQTEFASIELLREEQKPDGSWTDPAIIKPLYVLQQFPAADAPLTEWFNYRHWMDQNQATIANPPFLKTAADAEPWLEPGAVPPEMAPKIVPGQPAVPRPPGNPAAVGAPAANPNGQPNGGFNAIVQPVDPTIIVHDVTIEEGKAYRYSVRYKLYNPLFNNKVFAVPAVAGQFAMSGPDPVKDNGPKPVAWSGPIAVEPSSYVFVTKINQFTGQASFDIFEWKDGRWHPSSVPLNKPLTAGDPISGNKGVSKYILVDVRKDTRNAEPNYAIVMDGTGVLQSRNVRDDAADPIYVKLKQQAGAAAVAR
jgi:hypothetical protein